MSNWQISTVHSKAAQEVASLFLKPEVKAEIKRILRLLTAQPDPRQPVASAGLLVDELVDDAPGWFRVKIPRYAIRIVFRLVVVRNEQEHEISRHESVVTIQNGILTSPMHAAYRKDAYGEPLRKRYRQLHRED